MKYCNIQSSLMAIHEPLIETDILLLQQKFLQPGFHNLKFNDINSARLIISKVLKSLNYYHDIAILSDHYNETEYFNILNALSGDYKNNLTDFFLNQFYFDFLIIENTRELTSSNLLEKFQQCILDFNFDKTIPILLIK